MKQDILRMDQGELLQIVKDNPGILQKKLVNGGTNHRVVISLLRSGHLERTWTGEGYALRIPEKMIMKIEEYIKNYIKGCPSANGLTSNLHGEKFMKKFDEVYGLNPV